MTGTVATPVSPTPRQTEGSVEDAAVTGIALTVAILGVVLLTVVVGLVIRSSRRRRLPARPHPGRPFANP